jgi:hypothetical protein
MPTLTVARPAPDEHAGYYAKYIELVPGSDLLPQLERQTGETLTTLRGVSTSDSLRRYAEGKWSVREVVGHLTDAERVFSYRALRFGRGDTTPLPSFDQDPYIPVGRFDEREWSGLIGEFEAVRAATLHLLRAFHAEDWERRGTASGHGVSVRALGYIIAGQELHHMKIVRERYLQA